MENSFVEKLNYYIHNNGWTVFVEEDLKELSVEQIKFLGKLIVKNTVVVFKNQKLSVDDQLRICSTIGEVQPTKSDRSKHIAVKNGVLRVTGKKNDYGEEGLFGHKAALDWHSNQASNSERKPLIWLYGVEGTQNSKTSWINNIETFKDLSEDVKNTLRKIQAYFGYKVGSYSNSSFFKEHINYENPTNIVQINAEGCEGLYYPFLQIFGFKNHTSEQFNSLMSFLKKHMLQEKYMYHHEWEDNDVVISEQWLSIHKRWECETMDTRVLHRIAMDHRYVYSEK